MARDVEARLQELEDREAIRDRLYAYGHAIDYGDRDEWSDCWQPDGVLVWPHETYTGREAITGAFDAHSHAPAAWHKHMVLEERIRVSGDTATAVSYFTRIDAKPDGPLVRSIGRYVDELVRGGDGAWRFARRVCEREGLVPGAPVT